MSEGLVKDIYSIIRMIDRVYGRFCSLSGMDKLRIAYFCMAFSMLVGRVENERSWILIGLAVNLLFAYEQVRKHSIVEKLVFDNDFKTKNNMDAMDKESLRGMFEGAVLHEPQIVIAQSGAKVVYKETTSAKEEKPQVTDVQIANAIEKNQSMFWAQSAWAVVFCVCRDYLGMPDNMTEFERYIKGLPFTQQLAYECPDGTIQKTLGNNPYMKLPIDRWKANGGKERALVLAERLIAGFGEE